MTNHDYCIGVDFGTDSVRSIIVNANNGDEVASSSFIYPRWNDGLYCNAGQNQFRQHPLDYIEGIVQTIKGCLRQGGTLIATNVRAISIATTGSTPVAVNDKGIPLALLPEFESDADAMFILWKDHTAIKEAAEINAHAKKHSPDYTLYSGGIYSSEWFWSKLLHILRKNERVRNAAYTWVEHCDWMPFLLTGGKKATEIKRSVCAAGHKGLWAEEHGGFPPDHFFSALDPILTGYSSTLGKDVYTSDKPAGTLSEEWAERLGLSTDVLVGVGAIDAHMGAVGGQIESYYLSKVIGTSTCDMLVAPKNEINNTVVKGICGQVNGSIIPGMIGMEAGQSAFGDAYAWFKNLLSWPLQNLVSGLAGIDDTNSKILSENISQQLLAALEKSAAALEFNEHSELSVDWFNGRRTPDANQLLKGAITGINLGSDAPSIYRSIVEATCFGSKSISNRFKTEGITIKGLIGVGGIAKKSQFVMQTLADVMNMPIRVHQSEQTCALGAVMFAATVAGIYPNVNEAMAAIGKGFDKTYTPDKRLAHLYGLRYEKYERLGNYLERTI
nr:ribulokinase [Pedobacter panaciterrae]